MKKGGMLPLISIVVITVFMCVIILGRESLAAKHETAIAAMTNHPLYPDDGRLNESEKEVINILVNAMDSGFGRIDEKGMIHDLFIQYLKDYLSTSGINLNEEKSQRIIKNIKELKVIMLLEKEHDLKKMSLDARTVAINILIKIYKLCGLNLEYGMQGDILQITDAAHNVLYRSESTMKRMECRTFAIAVVLAVMAALICLCRNWARKNRLYMKVGVYDGPAEKEFA